MMPEQSQPALTGVVVRADGQILVDTGSEIVPATLRGKLKRKWQMVTSLVVVGDVVTLSPSADGGVVEEIRERRTVLSRPGFHGYEHVIAANVDQAVIVAAAHNPPFKRNLIDRFLMLARHGGIEPLVVVNKCDLEDPRVVRSWVGPLEATGVPVILTSAESGQGLDELARALRGKISVLAGHSGVGKSSLLNALCPELGIRTQGTSVYGKGRHTTTSSRLYPFPGGGYLVDTPGVKSLALWEPAEAEMAEVFPEIEALAAGCRFRDCSHTHEPRCAVRAAVEAGDLDRGRYENYLRLRERS